MNIFVLDKDIKKCAQYHCDKHVVKMILEYAQILCTVNNLTGLKTPYQPTHIKHPCVIWAGKSIANWRWLRKLAKALNDEYKYRYDCPRDHAAYKVIAELTEPNLPDLGLTEFAQAMPNEYKVKNSYCGTWTIRRI